MDTLQEWTNLYERLKKRIAEGILDEEQQREIIDLLACMEGNFIILKKAEKSLSRDPYNYILRDEYKNALRNALRAVLEADLLYPKIDQLLLHKQGISVEEVKKESFVEQLYDFKGYVEADGFDVFWEKRKEGEFVSNPETKAHVLYAAFFAGKTGRGRVLREVRAGGGFIDAIQIYQEKTYGIEMKMLGGSYGKKYAMDGADQLFAYLKSKDINIGYLLIFDGRPSNKKSELFDVKSSKEGLIKDKRKIFPIIIDINPMAPSKIGKS